MSALLLSILVGVGIAVAAFMSPADATPLNWQIGTVADYPGSKNTDCSGVDPAGSIAMTPDGRTAYVTNDMMLAGCGNSVSVIDVKNNRQKDYVHGLSGSDPQYVAISPDGTIAYVASVGEQLADKTISIVEVSNNTASGVVSNLPTADQAGMMSAIAFAPDEKTAYVIYDGHLNGGGSESASIGVIDVQHQTQTSYVSGFDSGIGPFNLKFDPKADMHKAYVANWHSKRIGVIDTQHNRYLTDVQIAPSSVASPYGIAFSNDGKTAYITESNCQVIVVDVASSKQTGAVPLDATLCRGGLGTYGIALSPSGKFAYVVTSSFRDSGNNYWDSVALIDVSKNVEMGTVGNFSGGGFWGWSGYSGMIPSPIVFLPGISAQKEGIAYVVSAQTAAVSILSIDGASAIVAGIEPYQGSANTEVTITGKNLLGTTGVTFGGGKAVPEAGSVSDTELKVWAPLPPSFLLNGVGAVSVVVQNPGGDGASPTNFRYTSTINSGGG